MVNWNIALDATGGPHLGGCDTCTGLLTLEPDGTVSRDAEYFTIGHLAKFVRPGAVRIASTSFGTTGWNGQIMDVAFRNPDGSTALVVHNENDDPRTFAVRGRRAVSSSTPCPAARWPPSPGRAAALHSRSTRCRCAGATATASRPARRRRPPSTATRPPAGPAAPRRRPGQYLQVDLGRPATFRRVSLDSGGNLGDYARSWTLPVSNDGSAGERSPPGPAPAS